MGVPISYNLRNLVERKGTTLMTALGIGLTVAVLVTSLALSSGLSRVFSGTGHPLQVLVMRKGATSELNSSVSTEAMRLVRGMPGVARTESGEQMVSPETISVVNLPSREAPDGMNITVRGVTPVGLSMRELTITQGRAFVPGQREVIVGAGVAKRYENARVGSVVGFGRGKWTVVGVFSTGSSGGVGGAADSEIWCDLNQLSGDFDRQGSTSSVLVRVETQSDKARLKKLVESERRAGADVTDEQKYYANMTSSGVVLQTLGFFVAAVMAIGSAFAATNTMYAAVARRSKEIGTLRALGFGRGAILRSFMLESICLSMLGGCLGILMAWPVNNASAGVGSFATFSEVSFQFRLDGAAIFAGLAFSAGIGAVGGFLPAWAASRKNIIQAMRDG